MLEKLPTVVSKVHNMELKKVPSLEKVKATVMGLNGNSVGVLME